MDFLTITAVVLTASIIESFLGVMFGSRKEPDDLQSVLDAAMEGRYSRLADEYEDI